MPEPCSGGRLQGLVPRIYTLALFFCSMHSIHRQPNMHRGRAKQIKCLNTCPELTTREAHSWSVSPKIFDTSLGYTDGRPPGAGKFAISMENAQEGVWLLVISLSYPRQILSNICVQWPSRARDACAKTPVPRRDFPPFLRAPLMAFSSMELVHRGTNDWR